MKIKQSKLLYFLSSIYIVTLLLAFVFNIQKGNLNDIMMCFVACITPFLFPAVMYLFHLKMTATMKIINIIFIYFASLIGSSLAGYTLPYYDKLIHFFSGILGSIIAMIIYNMLNNQKQQNNVLFVMFVVAVNLSIAVIWEFYEYSMLIFFNNDCIHHLTSGVHDSMTDMLCAAGGCIFVLLEIICRKN